MTSKDLLVLLGNQLFPIDEIKKLDTNQIFMAEDYNLCTYEKHHKLKILMFFILKLIMMIFQFLTKKN
jgi:deoxyribodipyrimidine photolyase-like uncharacterized protein